MKVGAVNSFQDASFFGSTSFLSSVFSKDRGFRLIVNMLTMPDGKLMSLPRLRKISEVSGRIVFVKEIGRFLFIVYDIGDRHRIRVQEGIRVFESDFNSPRYPVFFASFGDLCLFSNKFEKKFFSIVEGRFIELPFVSGGFETSADYVFHGCERFLPIDFPVFYGSRLWGIIDTKLIFSEPYFFDIWKPTNYYDFGDMVTNFGVVGGKFIVTTGSECYIGGLSSEGGPILRFERFSNYGGLFNTLCICEGNVFYLNERGIVRVGDGVRLLDEVFGGRFSIQERPVVSEFYAYGKRFWHISGIDVRFDDNFVERILTSKEVVYVGA